jgi:hypothetical protein
LPFFVVLCRSRAANSSAWSALFSFTSVSPYHCLLCFSFIAWFTELSVLSFYHLCWTVLSQLSCWNFCILAVGGSTH